MLVSRCCKEDVYFTDTLCGYSYFSCARCSHECDTTYSFSFPEGYDSIEDMNLTDDVINAKV